MVASVHGPDLRNRDMTLIYEEKKILGEVIDKAERPLTLLPSVQISRVILNPRAIAHLLHHLYVVLDPLLQPLGLQLLSLLLEEGYLLYEILLNLLHGGLRPFLRGHKIIRGIDWNFVFLLHDHAGDRIYDADSVYLVPKELYPHRLVRTTEIYIDRIASHTEGPSLEIGFRAAVQRVDEVVEEPRHAPVFPLLDKDGLVVEVFRIADAIEAGNR